MITVTDAYRFLSSMKTGLVLLGLIGLASAAGSVIRPDSFFRTGLFKLLLMLLLLNMALCTCNRLAGYLKRSGRSGTKSRLRFRELGILLLHAGIVLVLIGGAVYAGYGQTGMISLAEGETAAISDYLKTDNPFTLRLDKFTIEFNPDGSPSQYYSYVSILDGGKETEYRIGVNSPLQYEGIKAYQQSFGYLIEAEGSGVNGERVSRTLREGEMIDVPGTERKVKAYRYIPNFDPRYGMNSKTLRPDNPKIIYSVYEKGHLLGVGAASPGESVVIADGCAVHFRDVRMYTVLKVKSDPGLSLAAAGGLMLMAGVVITVFLSPANRKRRTMTANGGPAGPGAGNGGNAAVPGS
ncbi:cytochrome c biogenesis protein ResB [Thermacetogenium phaeum DSM 12270]|uniref:Cytochrome c biogenesis protein ResB n=1 Tax=Thermacetogenium phaeum (strain ATCC BAA-254 / DSM 26808 / PB) TaxID=1089553 RepID=K4LBU5_THEPS|nr:cytochrome c biogenesis protein ResB [Thermacetogenium phaeum]AFV10361.1 cytochrome c biogenesis protein ResB [Thermacetogenium phaeum DSM 12270]